MFSSYIPTIDNIRRTTTFTGLNPGPRTLTQSATQHNMFNRLDYGVNDKLRLFGSWNYGYLRQTGQLGNPDSVSNQINAGAGTDPNTFRADTGDVVPNSLYSFGGDWTPTSKLVVSARFGYFFNNDEQRGTPVGTRYVYQTNANANSRDLSGAAFPASLFNSTGFFNIPNNLATVYNPFKRKNLNVDGSYFVGRFLGGSHTFKTGYFHQQQSNDVSTNFQGGRVDLYFNSNYTPVTSTSACDAVIATNRQRYNSSSCQGLYGYFVVGTGVVNARGTQQTANAVYFQDAWNVGHGLTLNLGLRLDQEHLPPYDPNRFPAIDFGWSSKIAPRIGGAYDVLHNGKLKIYASYGKFFDIMKMDLARGSFGSDYWHNCVYAMDDPNFNQIKPELNFGGGCPASGPAPGVNTGRFIENVDFRNAKSDPRDPGVQPDMKPLQSHEIVTGVDWAITPILSLETRYSHKRLDQAIEDIGNTDNLGFYIGNPGSTYGDLLHRPTVNTVNNVGVLFPALCPECPAAPKANAAAFGVEVC